MYSFGKVMNGIVKYVDYEIVNEINGFNKWIFGALAGVVLNKGNDVFNNMKNNELIKMLNIINGEMIDVDTIYNELKKQASKTSISLNVPLLGYVTFTDKDVDKLYEYIKND